MDCGGDENDGPMDDGENGTDVHQWIEGEIEMTHQLIQVRTRSK